jgi:hypothetical protein
MKSAAALLALGAAVLCQHAASQQPPGSPPSGPPRSRPDPMLMPQVLVLPRAERDLQIDGSLIDWPELPAIRLDDTRQLSGAAQNSWRNAADASAIAFMVWDADALCVAISVKDDWHRALDRKSLTITEIPCADSVVLTFDPERNTRANGPDPGRREDREFWFADEASRAVVQWDRLRGQARMLDPAAARSVVLHDKEQGITTYEARLPWSEILPPGEKAAAGRVLDLQIVINDFDEATDQMPQTRIGLTFGVSPVVDPGLLASMMLVADAGALQGVVPEFPPKPGLVEPPAPPPEHWQQLTAGLLQHPPIVLAAGKTPAEALGGTRLELLERLETELTRFPRIDFLELHQRSHRRMNREVAGAMARGLPSWWKQRLESVSKNAQDPVPEGSVRIFRLPMGGWLLRTPRGGFLVDAAGPDLAEFLWGGSDFCVLTQPLDLTRRSDQLLLRMFTNEPPKPMFTHAAFHLPVVPMEKFMLAEQGKTYPTGSGARVSVLGQPRSDGAVTWSCSYRIELPGGPTVMLAAMNLTVAEVPEGPIDLMLLSPDNNDGVAIVEKVRPKLVIADDGFVCQTQANVPRVTLRQLMAGQANLLPTPSVLLAPGESWTVAAGK